MRDKQSWKRVCIVNAAFEIAFGQAKFRSKIKNIRSQELRRVRSVAWAPLLSVGEDAHSNAESEKDSVERNDDASMNPDGDQASGKCTTQTPTSSRLVPKQYQLLAAANDCGGVYLLTLSSPFINGSNGWEVEMLEMVALPTQDNMLSDIQSGIPDDGFVSRQNPAILDPGNHTNQKSFNARPSLLALALAKKSFIEDVIWSFTSCFDPNGAFSVLYVITQLSRTAVLRISGAITGGEALTIEAQAVKNSALHVKLLSLQKVTDFNNNRRGLSVAKTWGLASLQNSGIVVACTSVHPGDALEYLLHSQERSTLVFASDIGSDSFPWQKDLKANDASIIQKAVLEATLRSQQTDGLTKSDFSDRILKAATAARRLMYAHETVGEQDQFVEKCSFCSQDIPFESLVEASCNGGHQFSKPV
ncbi:MAG: hypothetical protein Q9191_002258 [Dirinaria sp. TL-2023a]